MRALAFASLAAALLVAAAPTQAQFAPKIPLQQLQAMFANMRSQTHWNVDGPLLWGFYFLDPERAKLEAAASELSAKGYRVVDIAKVDRQALFRLHVERIEVQTPESLYARDIELEGLARKLHIRNYDGMDAAPVPQAASAAAP